MTTERWRRITEVFDRVCEAPKEQRAELLAACGDEEVEGEVRTLLSAYDISTGFLEEPALAGRAELLSAGIAGTLAGARLGPYRVERQIGEGGMGVVYEARRADGHFEQRVAIKVLRQWTLSEGDIARFRSERQILAGLDHPNIARLVDGGATAEGSPYYAMEFVEGGDIGAYCRERGLTVRERLALFRKVCDAVEYAHSKGIIHRDLKPANVLVTPQGAPKLLDFGIAKLIDAAAVRTQTMNRVATLIYASPEQLRGGEVTRATDVYSLGVMLYELLTEQHPYGSRERMKAATQVEIERMICEDDPESPGKVAARKEWSGDLDSIVLQAMQKDPAARFPSAAALSEEIGRYLDDKPVQARAPRWKRQTRRRLRRLWPVATAVAALGIGAAWTIHRNASAAAPPRRSIAVLGFQNLAGKADAAWIGSAVTEMLTTELAATERVRLVSSDTVSRAKRELNIAESQVYSADVLERLRRNLNVDYFLTGSYLAPAEGADASLKLYVRLQEGATGSIAAAARETGDAANLPTVVSGAVNDLLSAPAWASISRSRSRQALTPYANPAAARLYAEAMDRRRKLDYQGSRELFAKAVEADPKNPLAHSGYSAALSALGYEQKAAEEAKRALDLSTSLPREERLGVEGRYYATQRDWQRAMVAYGELYELFPDNPEYGLRLAQLENSADKPKDALALLAGMKSKLNAGVTDARIDLAEADAYETLSDHMRSLAAAEQAEQQATRNGARALVAESEKAKADALYGLDRLDESLAASRSAEAMYRAVGEANGIASMLNREARTYWKKGDYAEHEKNLNEAQKIFEQIGNQGALTSVFVNRGLDAKARGDMVGALAEFEKAIDSGRELGQKASLMGALNNAGNVLRRLNRQEEAHRDYQECLSIASQINDTEQVARSHVTLTLLDLDDGDVVSAGEHMREASTIVPAGTKTLMRVLIDQYVGLVRKARGDLAGAQSAIEASLAMANELKSALISADDRTMLADLASRQGKPDEAQKLLADARAYYTRQKLKTNLWDAGLIETRVAIDAGKAAGTEKAAMEAAAGYHASHAATGEVDAYTALAQSWLAQGKPKEAQAAIFQGRAAFLEAHAYSEKMRYSIAADRVTAANGNPALAIQELRKLGGELESKGWNLIAQEARKAQTEAEAMTGRRTGWK